MYTVYQLVVGVQNIRLVQEMNEGTEESNKEIAKRSGTLRFGDEGVLGRLLLLRVSGITMSRFGIRIPLDTHSVSHAVYWGCSLRRGCRPR